MDTRRIIRRNVKEFRIGRVLFIIGLRLKLDVLRTSSNRWAAIHLFGPFFWITHLAEKAQP